MIEFEALWGISVKTVDEGSWTFEAEAEAEFEAEAEAGSDAVCSAVIARPGHAGRVRERRAETEKGGSAMSTESASEWPKV